ncbi:hypothetical protein DACRYDRAFT_15474 [Dacryopinax primogenitus]|uniref:Uncharacterized protein n=1 Tax=Dacryopinax primogenitus (strain DJM 731) TaxID=1858805 RepID=M5G2H3_DACPD|nr:uncharacterized protein DACRYDRAFT_15474 [Dacryopinax primogenitus]EJU02889.1 hypothetical protein DACRYDRAFT_15474 [Dacryopinax primogenitus]
MAPRTKNMHHNKKDTKGVIALCNMHSQGKKLQGTDTAEATPATSAGQAPPAMPLIVTDEDMQDEEEMQCQLCTEEGDEISKLRVDGEVDGEADGQHSGMKPEAGNDGPTNEGEDKTPEPAQLQLQLGDQQLPQELPTASLDVHQQLCPGIPTTTACDLTLLLDNSLQHEEVGSMDENAHLLSCLELELPNQKVLPGYTAQAEEVDEIDLDKKGLGEVQEFNDMEHEEERAEMQIKVDEIEKDKMLAGSYSDHQAFSQDFNSQDAGEEAALFNMLGYLNQHAAAYVATAFMPATTLLHSPATPSAAAAPTVAAPVVAAPAVAAPTVATMTLTASPPTAVMQSNQTTIATNALLLVPAEANAAVIPQTTPPTTVAPTTSAAVDSIWETIWPSTAAPPARTIAPGTYVQSHPPIPALNDPHKCLLAVKHRLEQDRTEFTVHAPGEPRCPSLQEVEDLGLFTMMVAKLSNFLQHHYAMSPACLAEALPHHICTAAAVPLSKSANAWNDWQACCMEQHPHWDGPHVKSEWANLKQCLPENAAHAAAAHHTEINSDACAEELDISCMAQFGINKVMFLVSRNSDNGPQYACFISSKDTAGFFDCDAMPGGAQKAMDLQSFVKVLTSVKESYYHSLSLLSLPDYDPVYFNLPPGYIPWAASVECTQVQPASLQELPTLMLQPMCVLQPPCMLQHPSSLEPTEMLQHMNMLQPTATGYLLLLAMDASNPQLGGHSMEPCLLLVAQCPALVDQDDPNSTPNTLVQSLPQGSNVLQAPSALLLCLQQACKNKGNTESGADSELPLPTSYYDLPENVQNGLSKAKFDKTPFSNHKAYQWTWRELLQMNQDVVRITVVMEICNYMCSFGILKVDPNAKLQLNSWMLVPFTKGAYRTSTPVFECFIPPPQNAVESTDIIMIPMLYYDKKLEATVDLVKACKDSFKQSSKEEMDTGDAESDHEEVQSLHPSDYAMDKDEEKSDHPPPPPKAKKTGGGPKMVPVVELLISHGPANTSRKPSYKGKGPSFANMTLEQMKALFPAAVAVLTSAELQAASKDLIQQAMKAWSAEVSKGVMNTLRQYKEDEPKHLQEVECKEKEAKHHLVEQLDNIW